MRYKILNLYAGIGGNRKLWGDNHDITAVELDSNVAHVYKSHFPEDTVIVGNAHDFLINHFREFDIIWSSPPCPTHSKLRTMNKEIVYPDMKLYQEIILLKHWFKGKWIVENVTPYYEPLIKAQNLGRHLFWANFTIGNIPVKKYKTCKINNEREFLEEEFNYDLSSFSGIDKRKCLRNAVVPEIGLQIFNKAIALLNADNINQGNLFNYK